MTFYDALQLIMPFYGVSHFQNVKITSAVSFVGLKIFYKLLPIGIPQNNTIHCSFRIAAVKILCVNNDLFLLKHWTYSTIA